LFNESKTKGEREREREREKKNPYNPSKTGNQWISMDINGDQWILDKSSLMIIDGLMTICQYGQCIQVLTMTHMLRNAEKTHADT
jgi:hypothetical protein